MIRAAKIRIATCLAAAITVMGANHCIARGDVYLAEDDSSTPLPPQRPAALTPQSPPPADKPSSMQSSITNIAPSLPSTPQAPGEPIKAGAFNAGPGTLLRLPPASHARMHQCAVEWQNMKATGTAEEKIWFNFALRCLTQ